MGKELYTLSRPISNNDRYAILNGNVFYLAIDNSNNIVRIMFPDEHDYLCITPQELRNEPNSMYVKALDGTEYDFIKAKCILPSSTEYLYKETKSASSNSDDSFDFDELERKLDELGLNDDDLEEARTVIKAALKDMVLVVETVVDEERKLTKQTPVKLIDILGASQNYSPVPPEWWVPKSKDKDIEVPLICINEDRHSRSLGNIANNDIKVEFVTCKFNKCINEADFISWLKINGNESFYDVVGGDNVWSYYTMYQKSKH